MKQSNSFALTFKDNTLILYMRNSFFDPCFSRT